MLMFYHSSVRHFTFSIVYQSITLIVGSVQYFLLKRHRAKIKMAKAIVVELINLSGINNSIRQGSQFTTMFKVVTTDLCFNTIK